MAMKPRLIETNKSVTATTNEAEDIIAAAREDAGFDKILKFRKGEYFTNDKPVPLGAEFVGHPEAWTKCWIKFEENKVLDRRLFRIARGAFGGKRAVGDLCSAWAKRENRGYHGQPIVQLQSGVMPTRKFGKVPRPNSKFSLGLTQRATLF